MPYVGIDAARARRRRENLFPLTWHAAWVLGAGAGTAWLSARGGLEGGSEAAALAVTTAAAGIGALLTSLGAVGRVVSIAVWGLAAALACQMTGGPQGPLAAWCLMPLAAAASFRARNLLALGAAASMAAVGVSTLSAVLLPLPGPTPGLTPLLGSLALGSTALGLASALIGLQVRGRRDDRRRNDGEQALRDLLEGQPQQLLMLHPSGRVIDAHGPALAGLSGEELAGRNLTDLAAPEGKLALDEALRAAAGGGPATALFAPMDDPDGWLEARIVPIDRRRLAAALRDARADRALEKARDSAEQQNAGKSRFLANMSHELRTPLNAIMGFSDIMRQRLFGPMGDRYGEYAELIHESGSHLLELINDVLDMSKIEAERFELALESFDAREAVSAVLRLMRGQADRAGVNLRGALPAEPLEAEADRRALKQIALNLISNALKFTPKTGSVTVTLTRVGEVLELVVADTGIGIAPADLARLGRPFEQAGDAEARAKGSGLGLSLVRAFASLHGGDMSIRSVLGEGTTVTVRMPVLEPAVSAANAR